VATHAPVALILRRGPSTWWQLIKWDLEQLTLTPGAWLKGTLYPRRSDISPDGRLFGYFALRSSPPPWDTYFAVSKLPWLTALAAWHTGGTWTGGCQFFRNGQLAIAGCMDLQPFYGHYPKAVVGGMSTDWVRRDLQNEYKRGWQALADDPEDERRLYLPATVTSAFLMRRPQPGRHGAALILAHAGVDFSQPGIEGVQIHYLREERSAGQLTPLPEAAWADWDGQGRLLMATRDGAVVISEAHGDTWVQTWAASLRDISPAPSEAPAWAQHW
jgi:hypothetical protein